MARNLQRFTQPFARSRIPFLLAEVITDGEGALADLVCRWANAPAAALLDADPAALADRRFSRSRPAEHLAALAPLGETAFSGGCRTCAYETALGRRLTVTAYQAAYGLCGCILEEQEEPGAVPGLAGLLEEHLPGCALTVQVDGGLRCLTFPRQLWELAGLSRREFLNRHADDLFSLIRPEDREGLLQSLLDAARGGRSLDRAVGLIQPGGGWRWVRLRGSAVSAGLRPVFYLLVLDEDRALRDHQELAAVRQEAGLHRALLDALPGRCALISPGGVRVSRGLCELTGHTPAELARRLAKDPFWRLTAEDGEGLTAPAPGDGWTRVCTLQRKGGEPLWVSLTARQSRDGVLALDCTDITERRQLETEHLLRSRERELMLSGSGVISAEYDPAADLLRLTSADEYGRCTVETVPGCRQALAATDRLHPEDREPALEALREACAKPQSRSFLCRGAEEQLWQVSLVSLADREGSVWRLLARIEDVTARQRRTERFRRLEQRRDRQFRRALAAARLDLTANRILDARSSRRQLFRAMFGNSADECLANLCSVVPEAEREGFAARLSREALLSAWDEGQTQVALRHHLEDEPHQELLTVIELVQQPDTGRVEAWCRVLPLEQVGE